MEVGENQDQKESENEQNNQNQLEEGMIEQEDDNLEDAEDNKLMYIYEWVDSIPLSRQKKNISRDFNDAVLFAEMIKYHYPKLVDLHNYPSASSTKAKMINWETLNKKVLEKIGLKLGKSEIDDLVRSKPNAIENLLGRLYNIIHGKPQMNNMNNKKRHSNNSNALRNNNLIVNNEEAAELINAINEKDQEIVKLQEYIESLEQKIETSKEKQKQLELEIKELNAI